MAEGKYMSKLVVVQFDPEEREVNDQTVRSVTVRDTASQAKINATVWANHKDVSISKGDVLVIEGKGSQTVKETDEGTKTYNNFSINGILNLGPLNVAKKAETASSASKPADDDIPF